jgi:hypothetical protein
MEHRNVYFSQHIIREIKKKEGDWKAYLTYMEVNNFRRDLLLNVLFKPQYNRPWKQERGTSGIFA